MVQSSGSAHTLVQLCGCHYLCLLDLMEKMSFEWRRTCIHHCSGRKALRALLTPGDCTDGLSFRAPHHLSQHRKNSNLKHLQAPSSGSEHNGQQLECFFKLLRRKTNSFNCFLCHGQWLLRTRLRMHRIVPHPCTYHAMNSCAWQSHYRAKEPNESRGCAGLGDVTPAEEKSLPLIPLTIL